MIWKIARTSGWISIVFTTLAIVLALTGSKIFSKGIPSWMLLIGSALVGVSGASSGLSSLKKEIGVEASRGRRIGMIGAIYPLVGGFVLILLLLVFIF